MNEKGIIDTLLPIIWGNNGEDAGKIIENYKKYDGKKYSDLLYTMEKMIDITKNIDNYEKIVVKYITMLNTTVPRRWHETYRRFAIAWLMYSFEQNTDEKYQAEMEKLVKEHEAEISSYLKCFLDKTNSYLGDGEEEIIAAAAKIQENKEILEKIPVELQNVKLYHGTSYENYLKIKKDGYIKPSNYDDGKYPDKNVEDIYLKESGYVFTSDSIDFPLSLCFGGYRDTIVKWARKKEKNKAKGGQPTIGVVFEIEPSNYEISYYRKDQSEFLIKGNVDLKDTRPMFFKIDFIDGIKQLSEVELFKELKKEKR